MRAALLAVTLLAAAPALGQTEVGLGPGDGSAHAVVYFVPELSGAVFFGVEHQSRIEGRLVSGSTGIAEPAVLGHIGYRRYFEGHGRLSIGGYVAGGSSLADTPERRAVARADAGVIVQVRGVSDDFFYWGLGLFAEAGLLIPRGGGVEAETRSPGRATRLAIGIETGPGMLWYFDPYLFGELMPRVGIETVQTRDVALTTFFAGLRLSFDATHR